VLNRLSRRTDEGAGPPRCPKCQILQAGLPQQRLYLGDSNVIYGTRYTSAILSLEETIG
jgi:hypothetical protein